MIDARHFAVRERLRNGLEVCFRALHPDDGERIVEAFSKLDADSIYFRFFGQKAEITEQDFRLIREMDFDTRVALLVTLMQDGREIVIGSASYARFGESAAEIAFLVEEDYQGLGIARKLLTHLGRIAHAAGITTFVAEVLGQNAAMLKVFAACGWPMETSKEDGSVHVTLSLAQSGSADAGPAS